jgi:hypothetical protein
MSLRCRRGGGYGTRTGAGLPKEEESNPASEGWEECEVEERREEKEGKEEEEEEEEEKEEEEEWEEDDDGYDNEDERVG